MVSSKIMRAVLPVLAFLSGVSGIAYEVLYARLLGSYLGSMFYVSVTLLAVFFVGLALGSFWSYRFSRQLPYVELIIGFYALAMAALFWFFGLDIIPAVTALPFSTVFDVVFTVALLVFVPAVAVGFSVPLFSRYLEQFVKKKEGFSVTYVLYNLGAAISVIAVEYIGIRLFGLTASLVTFGTLNILIGLTLLRLERPSAAPLMRVREYYARFRRDSNALFVVSIASGILQATVFGLYEFIIGPLNGHFAYIIAMMLLGLSYSAMLVSAFRWRFATALVAASVTMLTVFAFLHYFILGYAYMVQFFNEVLTPSYTAYAFQITLFAFVTLVPVFGVIGATVPALVRTHGQLSAGWFLGVASLGNAFGYLLFTFGLYERFATSSIVLFVGIIFLLAYIALESPSFTRFSLRSWAVRFALPAATVGVLCAVLVELWPVYVKSLSHWQMREPETVMSRASHVATTTVHKRFDSTASVVTYESGERHVLHHGNTAVETSKTLSNRTLREAFIGVLGTYYTDKRERALVVGLGVGTTPSAAADVFDEVVVSEVHPSMYDASLQFEKENDSLWQKENVLLRIEDGFVAVLRDDKKYDVIINTISSPKYYSAGKLWSRDYYEAAKDKLTDGGVFLGWVDVLLTERALRIIEKTLADSFNECVFHQLDSQYLVFVCSDGGLSFSGSDVETDGFFYKQLEASGWSRAPHLFARYTALEPVITPAEKSNTIDHPLLDHNTFPLRAYDGVVPYFGVYTKNNHIDPFSGKTKDRRLYCETMRLVDSEGGC